MKLKKWEIALFVSVIFTIMWGVNLIKRQENLADKLVRLHVVANSDSESDQSVKLKVRDEVLTMLTPLLENVSDQKEAEKIIAENISGIKDVAAKTLAENGESKPVTAMLGVESFPTRYYDTFTLPAGEYTSLRVIIGEGAGHNWWCVVFPPICATAAVEDAEAVGLTDNEVKLITGEEDGTVIKFKVLEIISELRELFE